VAIVTTQEERQLIAEGKLDPTKIEEYRLEHPVKEPEPSEIDAVKKEIKETNILYRESIQKNKDLYQELVDNRKYKEDLRNKIAELRIKKKKLLGIE
jgi:vacuolar-type H+-ATPase subunit I/STV1